MTLKLGTSQKTLSYNIAKERNSGKSESQAIAIGESQKRKALAMKRGRKRG